MDHQPAGRLNAQFDKPVNEGFLVQPWLDAHPVGGAAASCRGQGASKLAHSKAVALLTARAITVSGDVKKLGLWHGSSEAVAKLRT